MATPLTSDYFFWTDANGNIHREGVLNYRMTDNQIAKMKNGYTPSNEFARFHYMGVPNQFRCEVNKIYTGNNVDPKYMSPNTYNRIMVDKTINDITFRYVCGVSYFGRYEIGIYPARNTCMSILAKEEYLEGLWAHTAYVSSNDPNNYKKPLFNKLSNEGLFGTVRNNVFFNDTSQIQKDYLDDTDPISSITLGTITSYVDGVVTYNAYDPNWNTLAKIYNKLSSNTLTDTIISRMLKYDEAHNRFIIAINKNIDKVKSSNTKTYTNSTWSTSKTWYIKVTFSYSGTWNVVNYVTMIQNILNYNST